MLRACCDFRPSIEHYVTITHSPLCSTHLLRTSLPLCLSSPLCVIRSTYTLWCWCRLWVERIVVPSQLNNNLSLVSSVQQNCIDETIQSYDLYQRHCSQTHYSSMLICISDDYTHHTNALNHFLLPQTSI